MISVVIPTSNAGASLAQTLGVLIQASVDGLVREVVIVDAGSTDDTFAIADDAGARFIAGPADQAERIAMGCEAAKGPWLLVLQPGMRLGSEWAAAAKAHIADHPRTAARFRLALDDHRVGARLKEAAAGLFGPGGEAVLTPKALYGKRAPTRTLPARVFRIG
jgi:glycosyltransferase involved in cell wall biosynthesis